MNLSSGLSRRQFLQTTAAATLPAWFVEAERSLAAQSQSTSPNEKPNVALIGCGGMGTHDISLAAKLGNVVGLCDVDESHSGKLSTTYTKAKLYNDFRKLLDQNDIQIVLNCTPDHWHTLVNLAALKAGKDVYSEKPLTLTIDEGKRVVAAVRDSKRILQTGSQQRSGKDFRQACELVRNGRIGKLTHVTTI